MREARKEGKTGVEGAQEYTNANTSTDTFITSDSDEERGFDTRDETISLSLSFDFISRETTLSLFSSLFVLYLHSCKIHISRKE